MQEAFDRRWHQLAQEVLSGIHDWRVQHPRATLTEIEEELDHRLNRMPRQSVGRSGHGQCGGRGGGESS